MSVANVEGHSTLVLDRSTFTMNESYSTVMVRNTWDGGISYASILNSTFYENTNTGTDGNSGIIVNWGDTNVQNSTFSGNITDSWGSAIFNVGKIDVQHSTFIGNISLLTGGATLYNGTIDYIDPTLTGDFTVIQSLVSGTIDCVNNGGTFSEYNNRATGACGDTPATGFDPTLKNNGGSTLTHALLPGSNAIDATDCLDVFEDQRGVLRPQGEMCDIGSFEVIPATPTPTLMPATETPVSTPTTLPVTETPSTTQTSILTETSTVIVTSVLTETPIHTATLQTPTATETTLSVTATPDADVNTITNGGFEAELAPWVVKAGVGDKVKCNKAGKPVTTMGVCAFMFKGGTGENSKLEQTADLTGITFADTDMLDLSAWVKATNPAASGKLKVRVKYTDDTKTGKIDMNIVPNADNTELMGSYVLQSANVSKIKVQISHKSAAGKVYIDEVSLVYTAGTGSNLLPLP